jgi:hypothetical protein
LILDLLVVMGKDREGHGPRPDRAFHFFIIWGPLFGTTLSPFIPSFSTEYVKQGRKDTSSVVVHQSAVD